PRTLHLATDCCPIRDVLSASAVVLQRLGFIVVRPSVCVPDAIRRSLAHRHVALFVVDEDVGAATRWIRELSAASLRSHLVVIAGRPRAPGSDGCGHWESRKALADERAGALIAAGNLGEAEALVQSVVAEAAIRGLAPPKQISLRLAQIRFWQG